MTALEDLRHSRIDRPGSAAGAADVIAAAKSRRRGRYAIVASVLAVLAVLIPVEALAISHRGSEPARPAPVTRPLEYTGVGTVFKAADGPLQLCLGPQFSFSSQPGCSGGVTLRGIDPSQLPTVATSGKTIYTKSSVRVVGTYRDGVFTLTSTPIAVKVQPPSPYLPVPCAAPIGGWSKRPLSDSAFQAIGRYEAAHPAVWGGSWITLDQKILMVSFTGDLTKVRRDLATYSKNACVTRAAHTYQALQEASAALALPRTEINRLHINGGGIDEVNSQVVINVAAADQPITDYVNNHFPPGLIRLNPALTPTTR